MYQSYTSNEKWVKTDKNGTISASMEYKNDNGVVSSIKKGNKYIHGKKYDISLLVCYIYLYTHIINT